jgi:3-keto-L-gulonate-6-phosphate decarboxylase
MMMSGIYRLDDLFEDVFVDAQLRTVDAGEIEVEMQVLDTVYVTCSVEMVQ